MAHIRQEFALGLARGLGGFFSRAQFLFGVFPIGGIDVNADHA